MYQYHQLTATFEATIDRAALDLAIRRTCGSDQCTLIDVKDGRHTFLGPADAVMLLIGCLARFGHDGLIAVQPA